MNISRKGSSVSSPSHGEWIPTLNSSLNKWTWSTLESSNLGWDTTISSQSVYLCPSEDVGSGFRDLQTSNIFSWIFMKLIFGF